MRLLSGKELATDLRSQIKREVDLFEVAPSLAVVLCTDDPASELYVRKKCEACREAGIDSSLLMPFKNTVDSISIRKQKLRQTIEMINKSICTSILVQLPLPPEYSPYEIFDLIDPNRDVDGFHPTNVGLLLQGRSKMIPCTAQAVQHILLGNDIAIAGKRVTIINRSDVVGKPLAALLTQNNPAANGTVTICHDHTPPETLKEICLRSDIIVVAVGKANFLKGDMVPEGATVVDVGINRFQGKVVGDVEVESVSKKASALSTVPGGVGPLTIAFLLKNAVAAHKILFPSSV
jgi:methylenetetrahydrofolate dehydrogenase (NADP+)/methenyltetrahydrofolate cyclohydrolase